MTEPTEFLLENASLVLEDRVVERGWLAVSHGRIADLGEGDAPERGFDIGGDILAPGLVELHTDNLESHFAPRPHVRWQAESAVSAYDAQLAAAGITTVFDSLRAGSDADAASIGADLMELGAALDEARRLGHLRIEHLTHLRCEIASPDVVEHVGQFMERFPVHMMSLMDHTPGQRQFKDLATWRRFYMRKTPLSDAELDVFVARRLELHARHAAAHRARLVGLARAGGVVLASHDDADQSHVAESTVDGVVIAEFPTTMEAAQASRQAGISVMMGGPNVVRGGSHSGNVAAAELAGAGLLDILSSDYVPSSLLLAAFSLPRLVPGIELAQAVAMVSSRPADATGLADRGRLAAGLRADLVRIHRIAETPIVRRVFAEGKIAA